MSFEPKEQVNSNTKIFLSIIVFIVALLVYSRYKPGTYAGVFARFVLLYVLITAFLTIYKRNKVVRFFLKILWLPGVFIITFYPFLLALFSVIFSYGIVYLITVLFFEVLPADLFHYQIAKPVRIFLQITISSVVVAYYYDKLVSVWFYLFFKRNEHHKELSFKIMNQSRAKFSIYFLYFVALLILHTSRLNNTPVVDSELIEKAILESFGTFLAFERVIANWNLFKEEKSHQ